MDKNLDLEYEFNDACLKMKDITVEVKNDIRLKLYGLFKVATVGKYENSEKKSFSIFDFSEKYKQDAWKSLSHLSKEDAMKDYIAIYNKLTQNEEIISDLKFDDFDISQDLENSTMYSSSAGNAKKEIEKYKSELNSEHKLFLEISEKFYEDKFIVTTEALINIEKNFKVDFVNIRDDKMQTLTHVAVDSGNISSVKAFEELGLIKQHINIADSFKMTPMHIAAINFNLEIFKILLSYSPNNELRDDNGKTFVDYLHENEDLDEDILKILN